MNVQSSDLNGVNLRRQSPRSPIEELISDLNDINLRKQPLTEPPIEPTVRHPLFIGDEASPFDGAPKTWEQEKQELELLLSYPTTPKDLINRPPQVLGENEHQSVSLCYEKSILSMPLADLTACNKESDMLEKPLSHYIEVSEDIWHRLACTCIFKDDPMECVLSMRLSYLLSLNLGAEIFDILKNACGGFQEHLYMETRSFREITAPMHIENMLIEVFPVSPDVLKRVHGYGWRRWRDFLDFSEEKILTSKGISFESLSCLADVYLLIETAMQIQSKWKFQPEFGISSEIMFKSLIPVKFNARMLDVLIQRWGFGNEEPKSLEELGQKWGVTRERIRQIEKKGLKLLESKKHNSPFNKLIMPLIIRKTHESRGVFSINEAAVYLKDIMGWEDELPSERQYSELILRFTFPYDVEEKLIIDKEHPCVICCHLSEMLNQLFEEDNRKRSYEEIFHYLHKICAEEKCKEASLPFTKTFLQWVIINENDIFADEASVYHSTTWVHRKGSRVQQIEEILSDNKKPMHFEEIYKVLKEKYPLDQRLTPRGIHGVLTRDDVPFLLWDRGTYIHANHAKIPKELINVIENWLVDRLTNIDSPLILVGAAWKTFEEECLTKDLSSEYALYTCLRNSNSNNSCRLGYPKYPQIYLTKNFQTRIPYTLVIEDHVVQNGGVISSEHLRSFAVDTLGLKEYQFQQGLARIDGLFRNAQGEYVSVNSLKIDFRILKKLNEHIVPLVQSLGTVSVKRILGEKAITCEQSGISDPVILYNALKTIAPDELDYPGYPRICRAGKEKTKGFNDEVIEWLKSKSELCSWDELEDYFVRERKFNENTLRAALHKEEIFRYAQGVFVHGDTLGITSDEERIVYAAAEKEFERSLNIEKPFALISDILNHYSLPQLKNEILWTQTLLAHIFDSLKGVKILGSARNAFICLPHPSHIETFEDLVYILLKEREGGACLLADFKKYLQTEGVIEKELTASMLHDQKKVTIQDGVLYIQDAERY